MSESPVRQIFNKLNEVMKPHGGDWTSDNSLTVVSTLDLSPTNKIFTGTLEAEVKKEAKVAISDGAAIGVGVPSVEALGDLLRFVGSYSNLFIVSGRFIGAPGKAGITSEPFRIMSSRKAATKGFTENGWFEINDIQVTTRSKDNVAPVSWIMFDCDFLDDMPEELRHLDYEKQWWPAMESVWPSLSEVGRVHCSSSNNRLVHSDGSLVFDNSPSSHTWLRVNDPSVVGQLRMMLLYRALLKGQGFIRTNKAGARTPWAIFDPSVFSPERCAFEGSPTTFVQDTEIAPPLVTVYPGGEWDVMADNPPLTVDDFKEITERYDLKFVSGGRAGVSDRVAVGGLTPETPIDLMRISDARGAGAEGSVVKLAEIHAANAHLSDFALKCQVPLRESTSYAGTVYIGPDRMPYVNDFGPPVVYHLSLEEKAKFPVALYKDKLNAILATSVDPDSDREREQVLAAQWAAATLAAVLSYKGYDKTSVGAEIRKIGEDNKATFLPNDTKTTRGRRLMEKANGTISRIKSILNPPPAKPKPPRGGVQVDARDGYFRVNGSAVEDDVLSTFNQCMAIMPSVEGSETVIYSEVNIAQEGHMPRWIPVERGMGSTANMMWNQKVEVLVPGPNGQMVTEYQPAFPWWREHPNANYAKGSYFRPEFTFRDGWRPLPYKKMINRWQGYMYNPLDREVLDGDKDRRSNTDRVLWHILHIWCGSDPEKYHYVMNWLAGAIQFPAEQGFTTLSLKSGQGSGKTIIIERILLALFGVHGATITSSEHLFGKFGEHLAELVFVNLNEAIYGGDKAHKGQFKSMNDKEKMIEGKYKKAGRKNIFVKLLITTNSDWYAPVDLKDRRVVTVDVSNEKQQDKAYFGALADAIDNGGREGFLRELVDWDVDLNLCKSAPKWSTEAGEENALRSLPAHIGFLHTWFDKGEVTVPIDRIEAGSALLRENPGGGDFEAVTSDFAIGATFGDRKGGGVITLPLDTEGETTFTMKLVYAAYVHYVRSHPDRYVSRDALSETAFGKMMLKLVGSDGRGVVGRGRFQKRLFTALGADKEPIALPPQHRPRVRVFRSLGSCRLALDEMVGFPLIWSEKDGESAEIISFEDHTPV